jgi:hypothetical protein
LTPQSLFGSVAVVDDPSDGFPEGGFPAAERVAAVYIDLLRKALAKHPEVLAEMPVEAMGERLAQSGRVLQATGEAFVNADPGDMSQEQRFALGLAVILAEAALGAGGTS